MKSRTTRWLAWLLAVQLSLGGAGRVWADTAPAVPEPSTPSQEEMQPKFVWGLLVNVLVKFAMSAFTDWAFKKLTSELTDVALSRMQQNSGTATIVSILRFLGLGSKSAGAPENARAGDPTVPLKVEDGRENYQGVHVALVGFDRAGHLQGFRPLTAGFRNGERFKLRVLPTFEGLLVIENINPRGERRQIYPSASETALQVKAGTEILVPVAPADYFEFTGVTGDEQLVITLRDPRARESAASAAPVFRKDEANGSNFVQETPPGRYPVIAQGIHLSHVR